MKKIALFFMMALMVSSTIAGYGNSGAIVADGPYKVGDYYNDGTKEGIVFQVSDDGLHGKIVSLIDHRDIWAVSAACENATGATSTVDGMDNLERIKKQPDWETNYPAFAWCASLGSSWYLPALEELWLIHTNKSLINQGLKKRGAVQISDDCFCWSSTEDIYEESCACGVFMNDGDEFGDIKDSRAHVRAVSVF